MTKTPDWEGFARDLMNEWPVRDVDGAELFEAALSNGMLREIPGGYNPEEHTDTECICPEEGDPWYEYAFVPTRTPAAPQVSVMDDGRVRALVDALRNVIGEYDLFRKDEYERGISPLDDEIHDARAALADISEPAT